jgi:ABC-2 type transport system permease protein
VLRIVRLYFRLLGLHVRAMLEYKSDFWIMAGATILMQVVNLVFLWAIFARIPAINGWQFPAVVAMFALVAIAEGVGSFFFEGTWRLADMINTGSLDYLVVRPYPIVLQVTSAEVGINGLSNITTGGIMLGFAVSNMDVNWSVLTVLIAIVLLLSAVTIRVAINLATNSVSFWLSNPNPLFAMAVHQVGELAKFPLSIYPAVLKGILGFAIPFGFISSFPLEFLVNNSWVGLLTPLVAAYCVGVALLVFSRGRSRYESSGN